MDDHSICYGDLNSRKSHVLQPLPATISSISPLVKSNSDYDRDKTSHIECEGNDVMMTNDSNGEIRPSLFADFSDPYVHNAALRLAEVPGQDFHPRHACASYCQDHEYPDYSPMKDSRLVVDIPLKTDISPLPLLKSKASVSGQRNVTESINDLIILDVDTVGLDDSLCLDSHCLIDSETSDVISQSDKLAIHSLLVQSPSYK